VNTQNLDVVSLIIVVIPALRTNPKTNLGLLGQFFYHRINLD